MERLTDRDSRYLVHDEIYASGMNTRCKEMTGQYSKDVLEEAVEKLASYEDTGLSPEEIQEAVDLLDRNNDHAPAELKKWVERCTWHVRKCAELSRKLEYIESAEANEKLLILPEDVTISRLKEVLRKADNMARDRLPSASYTAGSINGFGEGEAYVIRSLLGIELEAKQDE